MKHWWQRLTCKAPPSSSGAIQHFLSKATIFLCSAIHKTTHGRDISNTLGPLRRPRILWHAAAGGFVYRTINPWITGWPALVFGVVLSCLHDCILNIAWHKSKRNKTIMGVTRRGHLASQYSPYPQDQESARRNQFKNIQNDSTEFYFKLH